MGIYFSTDSRGWLEPVVSAKPRITSPLGWNFWPKWGRTSWQKATNVVNPMPYTYHLGMIFTSHIYIYMVSHWGCFINALSLPHQQLRTTPSKGRGLLAVFFMITSMAWVKRWTQFWPHTIRPCDFRPPQVNFRYPFSIFSRRIS